MAETRLNHFTYLKSINALRAIAVALVFVNHLNPSLLPSGFIGVDIFFVISGFVITNSIIKRGKESNRNFLLGFYARRFARILPTLLAYTLITLAITSIIIPNSQYYFSYAIRAIWGLSNISFYHASIDYFSDSGEMNPFLQTWSLGVEEQFYLILPILISLTGFKQNTAKSKRITTLISILALASFGWFATLLHQENISAAYYLITSRFWELGLGCITCLILARKRYKFNRFPITNPTRTCLLITPLFTIVALIPEDQLGISIVLSITFSILFVALSTAADENNSFLANNKVIQFIGNISYSLYLWHWGIICFAKWTIGINKISIMPITVVILLISWWSYHHIEKRSVLQTSADLMTFGRKINQSIIILLGATIGIKSIQFLGPHKLYAGDYDSSIKAISRGSVEGTEISQSACSWLNGQGPPLTKMIEKCSQKQNKNKKIAIIGDSFAGHLSGLAETLQKQHEFTIQLMYVHSTAAPNRQGKPTDNKATRLNLETQSEIINHTIGDLKAGDVIIISNNIPERKLNKSSSQEWRDWVNALKHLLTKTEAKDVSVVIISALPSFSHYGKSFDALACTREWFRPLKQKCFRTTSRSDVQKINTDFKKRLKPLLKLHSNLLIYDPLNTICPSARKQCSNNLDKQLIYFDNTHLNVHGSSLLAQDFNAFLVNNQLINQ